MGKILFFFSLIFFFGFNLFSFEQIGVASWYGPNFHGRKTANGEVFNTYELTAAHKTLPFGSIVKVISLETNEETVVRINDRGPFKKDRIIDLSMAAAEQLGLMKTGTMNVKIVLLEVGKNHYRKPRKVEEKYNIQVASFSNEELANNLLNKLKEKNINVSIKEVNLLKTYYRVVIEGITYAKLQEYRLKLNIEGINNYMVKKIM
ncbi:MAG: hypothetical protein A2Y34_02445 [Spirochaetes bacterium GWC1_27_15]|nr:MAG: hypothetical protein A2Z98_15020 [Spirochaetes bacterium GWB1_27_13]OHD28226.1 MAG: hypothetical protein A2Y34_02445 [Spirochaetes bacterium GWC1_27_15]